MSKKNFKTLWIEQMTSRLLTVYPDLDEQDTYKFLLKIYNKHFTDVNVQIDNNYKNFTKKTTLKKFISWYYKKQPITTEYGVLFKQHDECESLDRKSVV